MSLKVLSVGQCVPDHMSLRLLFQKAGAEVIGIDFEKDIAPAISAHNPKLILVNRIFDRDRTSGLEVIKRLHESSEDTPPTMLISNYEEAQEQAVALGALPGFGKSALHDAETLELVQQALSRS